MKLLAFIAVLCAGCTINFDEQLELEETPSISLSIDAGALVAPTKDAAADAATRDAETTEVDP